MQLEWVTTFLAVVDEGGFGAAARSLYRSQGRVSSHVHELERCVGAPLFDRGCRPVRLTAAGQAYLHYARAISRQAEAGRAAAMAMSSLSRGTITLGTFPSAGELFVAPVLAALRRSHPHVTVELVEEAVLGLDHALVGGRVTVAIRPWLPFRPSVDMRSTKLWRESVRAVVPLDHRLAADRGPLPIEELVREPIVTSGRGLQNSGWAYQLLSNHGVVPTIACVADQPQILVGLAAAGFGVGVTNQLALQTLRTEHLCIRDFDPPLHRDVGVFWKHTALEAGSPASLLLATVLTSPVPPGTQDLRREADVGPVLDHIVGAGT